ncbi:MAG: YbaB/EbfC family nucleoid-associated protein [Anaerolineae bacterium]|nr:YbaB/EbfC family nucleoid-associated protein [Anaerolineae bacterium]
MQLNPNDLMKQVQQMQSQMESIQEEAHKEILEISAGGGMVTLTINGALDVLSIKLDPEVVDPDDVEMLQDLVLAAVNEGIQKAQAMVADRMAALTGGLGIPGL